MTIARSGASRPPDGQSLKLLGGGLVEAGLGHRAEGPKTLIGRCRQGQCPPGPLGKADPVCLEGHLRGAMLPCSGCAASISHRHSRCNT